MAEPRQDPRGGGRPAAEPASGRGRPATLRQVAERAGVHASTASRVLRQREPVDGWSASALRVREVAEELGYRPNLWAASLRTRKTTTIGAVMPRLTDSVVATIYEGIEQAARESGYSVLLSSPPDDPDEQRAAIGLLAGRRVDGLLLSSMHSPARDFVAESGVTVPMVAVNRHADAGLPSVTGDDRGGGALAGRHLLGCGYRRLGAIGGPPHATTGHDRLAGFLEAVEGPGPAGAGVRGRIAHTDFTVPGGVAAARELLERPDRPDALFTVSDSIAIGVLGAARDLGLRIPEDLGLVGYNDIPVAAQLPVPLTTIATPARGIGAAAVRMLLDAIGGGHPEPHRLDVALMVRGSTRGPAA